MSVPRPGIARSALGLWLPPAVYAAVIFWLSGRPVADEVALLPDWLHSDKLQHGLAYAGLAALLVRAMAGGHWRGMTTRRTMVAVALAIVYGVSDEWHQSFVPERSADAADVLADAIGASVGGAVVFAWGIIRRSP